RGELNIGDVGEPDRYFRARVGARSATGEHERTGKGKDETLFHHWSFLSMSRTPQKRATAPTTRALRTAIMPVVSARSRETARSCPSPLPPMTNSPTTAPATDSTT